MKRRGTYAPTNIYFISLIVTLSAWGQLFLDRFKTCDRKQSKDVHAVLVELHDAVQTYLTNTESLICICP